MSNRMLSILIPSRNEMFLKQTIEDILKNIEADTEVIAVLDGHWPPEPIEDNPRVILVHLSESIGQRAATNMAARMSRAKYLMKVDAHCAFDKGFDVKLMNDMQDNWTQVPLMRNLHAFDWVCECGHRTYQGPTKPCEKCGKFMKRELMWIAKTNPQSTSYRFDTTLHFQYWQDYKKKQIGDLVETFSLQGSCFMCTREKYFDLNICDETWGSWGNQGTEVAVKTWLSGGRVIVNKKTFYAHMFRTQGGDFSFPYPQSGRAVEKARQCSRDIFFNNKFEKQIYPLSWLIEKFKPIPDWHEESGKKQLQDVMQAGEVFYKRKPLIEEPKQETATVVEFPKVEFPKVICPPDNPTKGIIYYSDNRLNPELDRIVKDYLLRAWLPITSVTLEPMDFGNNFVINEERSRETLFKQILKGIEEAKQEILFFAEHDVLYPPEHFEFTPSDPNTFYYNGNYWFLRLKDGFAIHYNVSPLSGLVGYRDALLTHFRERMELIEKEGFSLRIGFEPMTHRRIKWKNWYNFEIFMPEVPNVDIAHNGNVTWKRWKIEQFRRKPTFWHEGTIATIPKWENLQELLSGIT